MKRRLRKRIDAAVASGEVVSGQFLVDCFEAGTRLNAVARNRIANGLADIGYAASPAITLLHVDAFRLYRAGSPMPSPPSTSQRDAVVARDRPIGRAKELRSAPPDPVMAELDTLLRQAIGAGREGDVASQEHLIRQARDRAASSDGVTRRYSKYINGRVRTIRPFKCLGFAGDLEFFEDRIVSTADDPPRIMDGLVKASVETAGQLSESQRPTLTRMAIGAALPGSALLPGLAFQKKTVTDHRELYLVIEHPTWARVLPLDPTAGQAVREIAAAINRASQAHALKGPSEAVDASPQRESSLRGGTLQHDHAYPDGRPSLVDQLAQLAGLRDTGALTTEEFELAKSRLLSD